jgi:hypothetical protein
MSETTETKPKLLIDGKDYTIEPLGPPEINEFLLWVTKQQPDPMKLIAPYLVDPAFNRQAREMMVDRALLSLRRVASIDSPEFMSSAMTPDGLAKMCILSFKKQGIELDELELRKAIDGISLVDLMACVSVLLGFNPEKSPE